MSLKKIYSFITSFLAAAYKKRLPVATILFVILIGPLIALFTLNLFFPSELLRSQSEILLAKMLGGKVKISYLSFTPLNGLQVKDIFIDSPETGSIKIDHLNLDYDLLALFRKKLIIHSIEIANAKIEISLPPSGKQSMKEKPSRPAPIPSVPIDIHMEELIVTNTYIKVFIDEATSVELKNIELKIDGSLKDNSARLRGKMAIEKVEILMEEKALGLPFGVEFQLTSDITKGDVAIEKLVFSAGTIAKAEVSASVTDFFDKRDVGVKLALKKLDLSELRKTLRALLPHKYQESALSGVISGFAEIDGNVKRAFNGSISASLSGESVLTTFGEPQPGSGTTDFNFQLTEARIMNNLPVSTRFSMEMENFNARLSDDSLSFKRVKAILSLPAINILGGNLEGSLIVSGEEFRAGSKKQSALVEPFDINISIPTFSIVDSAMDSVKASIHIPELSGKYQDISSSLAGFDITAKLSGADPLLHRGEASFALSIRKIEAKDEKNGITLLPTTVALKLPRINLHEGVPDINGLTLDIESRGGRYKEHSLDGLSISASGGLSHSGEVKVGTNLKGESFHLDLPQTHISFPASLSLELLGKLGPGFEPKEIDFRGGVNVNSLPFNVASPDISGVAEKIQIQLEGDYTKTSGQLNTRIDSHANLSELRAKQDQHNLFIKHSRLDATSDIAASLKKGLFENIGGEIVLRLKSAGLEEVSTPAAADSILFSANIRGEARDLTTIDSLELKAETTLKGAKSRGVGVKALTAKISAKTDEAGFLHSSSRTGIEAKNITYDKRELHAHVNTLSLSMKTLHDLENNYFLLSDLLISGDDFLKVKGEGSYRPADNSFSVKSAIDTLDIEKAMDHLDGKNTTRFKQLRGILSASLKASGKIPDFSRINPIDTPVAIEAVLDLTGGGGEYDGIKLSGANMNQFIGFTPEDGRILIFKNNFSLDTIALPPESPVKEFRSIYNNIDFSLRDFNILQIEKAEAGMDGAGFRLEGSVSGLQGFIPPSPKTIGQVLERVYINIKSVTYLKPASFTDFLKSKKISAGGALSLEANALKDESGAVSLSTRLQTEELSLSIDDFSISGVNISVPARKEFSLRRPMENPPAIQRAPTPYDYFPDFDDRENLSIERISTGLATLSNITARVELKNDNFSIRNLAANLLGGGAGGNIRVNIGERPGTEITLNFSDIDINSLLQQESKVEGESAVSGVLRLTLILYHKGKRVDFDTVELSLHITKIGRESLDRILLLIDPKESKPAIIHARSKLKFANPSSAKVVISGGFLSLNIDFQEGVISSVELDRVPVGSIRKLKFVNQMLKPLQEMSETMKLFASDSYVIDETGRPVFYTQESPEPKKESSTLPVPPEIPDQ